MSTSAPFPSVEYVGLSSQSLCMESEQCYLHGIDMTAGWRFPPSTMRTPDREVNGVRYNPRERVVYGVRLGEGFLEVDVSVAREYPEYLDAMAEAVTEFERCGTQQLFWESQSEGEIRMCIGAGKHDHFERFTPQPDFGKTSLVREIGIT